MGAEEKRLAMAVKVADSFIAQCISELREERYRLDQTSSGLLSLYLDLDLDNHNNIESGLM